MIRSQMAYSIMWKDIRLVSNQSRIIFPVLEPFGRDLEFAFQTNPTLRDKYIFYPLYDTIKAIAQTYANLNRFIIQGNGKVQRIKW